MNSLLSEWVVCGKTDCNRISEFLIESCLCDPEPADPQISEEKSF